MRREELLKLREELRAMNKEDLITKYLVVAEFSRQKTEMIQNMEQQFKEAGYESERSEP